MATVALTDVERQIVETCFDTPRSKYSTYSDLGAAISLRVQQSARPTTSAKLQLPFSLSENDRIESSKENKVVLKDVKFIDSCQNMMTTLSRRDIYNLAIDEDINSYSGDHIDYMTLVSVKIVESLIKTVRILVGTVLIILLKLLKYQGGVATGDRQRYAKLRRAVRDAQIRICRELFERALDTYGVNSSYRDEKIRTMFAILEEAALETNAASKRKIYKTSSTRFEEARERSLPQDVRQINQEEIMKIRPLSLEDVCQIQKIGSENKWRDREDKSVSCFTWIKEKYGQWLGKGLMQNHLLKADKDLYFTFKKKVSREGFPDWLQIPMSYDAELKKAALAGTENRLLAVRALSREKRRAINAFSQLKNA